MKRILVICLFSMVGCQTETIVPSFEYASTSLGIYNSGLINIGQLFAWDTASDTLIRLDQVPFPSEPTSRTQPTALVASDVSALTFNAGVDAAVKAKVSAAVRDNVSIQVVNGSREDYGSIFTLLSKEIVRKRNELEDVDRNWLLTRAVQPNSGLLYVLVRGMVTSDKAELISKKSADGKLEIAGLGDRGANVVVDLSRERLASCVGTRSPCFLSAQVLRAYINEKGNYDFEPIGGISNVKLASLFKTL